MADKMLRIAGRNPAGTSQPFNLNERGDLEVSGAEVTQIHNTQTHIETNGEKVFGPYATSDFNNARMTLALTDSRDIQVFIEFQQLRTQTEYVTGHRMLIYDSALFMGPSVVHAFEYDLFPQQYRIIIKNMSATTALARVTETRRRI